MIATGITMNFTEDKVVLSGKHTGIYSQQGNDLLNMQKFYTIVLNETNGHKRGATVSMAK